MVEVTLVYAVQHKSKSGAVQHKSKSGEQSIRVFVLMLYQLSYMPFDMTGFEPVTLRFDLSISDLRCPTPHSKSEE